MRLLSPQCLRAYVTVFLILTLASCTSKKVLPPKKTEPIAQPQATGVPSSPFSLEIIEDVNDGASLRIHGRIRSATNWPANDIVVRLAGMKSGEQMNAAFYPLPSLMRQSVDDKTGKVLSADDPVDFFLAVPSKDLTDYQLELLWGKEAKIEPAQVAEASPIKNIDALSLQAVSVQRVIPNCGVPPCPASFRVAGRLFNSSDVPVQRATLGVGFVWVASGSKLDLSAQIPQDEENVEITGLNLAPQQTRPFKLEIDRVVPEVAGGSYQPVVRIISTKHPAQ